ncbi:MULTISPECIES: c-type cytochrome [Microvirga]|uniref:c-type cytochrome n=1 Tax=Microvirga TaxID=186650 RepID=UPI001CFE7801|nr:cytochrome c [Microvirga lenta]MCB5173859.1 cytochrome c [Microvirga lenta]
MKNVCAVAVFGGVLSSFVSVPADAADPHAGRQKVVVCQACHGMDGLSKNPEAPNLAGQVEGYLVKTLKDYRSLERRHESMNIVAKDLSDEDIANVAAYYASIQVDVLPP